MGAALYMAFFFCLHSASVLLSFRPFHSAITLSFPPFLILFCSLFCLLYFDVHRCFHFFVLPFPFLLFWSLLPILLFPSASMPSSFLSFPLSVSVCFLISCPCSLNFSHLCDSIDPISLHIYIYFFFFEVVVSVLHIAAFSSSVFLAPFTFCIVILFGYLLLPYNLSFAVLCLSGH